MRKARVVLLPLASVPALFCAPAWGQILATGGRQMSSGSWQVIPYYQGTSNQDLTFASGGGTCSTSKGLPLANCQAGSETAHGDGGGGMLKIVYQPWDGFQYYAVGGAGQYSLGVPSAAYVNTLTGTGYGTTFGGGMRAILVPDTIVTPAVALDLSFYRSQYFYNQIAGGGLLTPVDDRLNLMQYQAALEISHLFPVDPRVSVEPYGGVKWLRSQSDLYGGDGSRVGGVQDTVTPFLGCRLPVYDHEALFAEAAFVDGVQYAAGVNIQFGGGKERR